MSHTWPASERYGIAPAPGGLALVQDFLNTVGIQQYGPDLLADPELGRVWVAEVAHTWSALRGRGSPAPTLTEADVAKLRALRTTVAGLVAGQSAAGPVGASASFVLSGEGHVRLEPTGTGWRWLASALWAEILLSQQHDTWRRIKQCHYQPCGSTFYDRSKNNSGVWHDVKTCGNAANLRASRARRREREHNAAASG